MLTKFFIAPNEQLTIHYFPVLNDNYTFVLHERVHNICAVIDPAVAEPVIDFVKHLDSRLVAIFNTHHHHDHVGGNRELVRHYPDLLVYGGMHDRGRIPLQQFFLGDQAEIKLGTIPIQVLFIPAHTRAHIAYFLPETRDLFCGDTLFACGCGRLFEGTPQQLLSSLQKLCQLPDSTRVWCAHEYTLKNIQFALTVQTNNPDLQLRYAQAQEQRLKFLPTIPSTIALEKLTNPFLRWHDPVLQQAIGHTDPARILGKLRGMRDLY